MRHNGLEFTFPCFMPKVGKAVTVATKADQIAWGVVAFVVVDMVNVQGVAYFLLLFTAFLTGVIVSLSNLLSQGVIEFWGVIFVESLCAHFCKMNAVRAIYITIPPFNKALSFLHNSTAPPSTISLYSVVVSVIFAAPSSIFCRIFAFTSLAAKVIIHALYMPTWFIKLLAAISASNVPTKLFTIARMTTNKFFLSPPVVVFVKDFTATASAFNSFVRRFSIFVHVNTEILSSNANSCSIASNTISEVLIGNSAKQSVPLFPVHALKFGMFSHE